MIRVTIELLPHGDIRKARTLGVLDIRNDTTGDEEIGNYVGTLHAEYTGNAGRSGSVEGFRRNKNSVWSLVGAFLKLFGHTKHPPRLMEKHLPKPQSLFEELEATSEASS